jgi:hypothetical protein
MVNDIGFHFWIAHLVDLNGLYKKRYSKVKSDVGKYAQFSKQICLFLRSVLLPFWKFLKFLNSQFDGVQANLRPGTWLFVESKKWPKFTKNPPSNLTLKSQLSKNFIVGYGEHGGFAVNSNFQSSKISKFLTPKRPGTWSLGRFKAGNMVFYRILVMNQLFSEKKSIKLMVPTVHTQVCTVGTMSFIQFSIVEISKFLTILVKPYFTEFRSK